MNFGVRLRELRTSAGLTQSQLAEKINLSKANVSKYEAGIVEPNLETLFLICKLFSVSADYLLGLNESKQATDNTSMAVPQISKDLAAIVKYYNQLSGNGQEKALEYIQMLKEYEQAKEKKND